MLIFMLCKIISRAGLNPFTGLIRPPGRTFDTPDLCSGYPSLRQASTVFTPRNIFNEDPKV